ncbi:phosphatidylinositol 4,5-bisphosphate 3-kinase catalytic subunit beta isoform-like isoform X2 [Tigriopus californicus]|uniref:phosphatidylinositol 4,5-bisphosphate 3-kinase catalytic subunit beta isoform-like isoform X2 n=1 Tax=Tigriopus californicus TaxID=6832 RepID=UPI0027DAA43F|nr:phosphatidylinositol 4,5-bisphosphate 3-kinase catalytic subunit beta isoform-like isoform X2 [Tigriopus californicus]
MIRPRSSLLPDRPPPGLEEKLLLRSRHSKMTDSSVEKGDKSAFSRLRSGSISTGLFLGHHSSKVHPERSSINSETSSASSSICAHRSDQSPPPFRTRLMLPRQESIMSDHVLMSFESGPGSALLRGRSGSFNVPRSPGSHDTDLSSPLVLSRERSLHDLSSDISYVDPFDRSRNSLELFAENEFFGGVYLGPDGREDFEEINCLLPNGIIMDLSVHPDDEIIDIKQLVLNRATTDERLPLRGCLNPDGSHYTLKYVSSNGEIETCYDEAKTLRELKPFQNLLKFEHRVKDQDLYEFRNQIGKLIGKNLQDFDELRNPEVNDFRWQMKLFCRKIAQARRIRLKDSWEAQILYQFPPRIVSSPCDSHCYQRLKVRLLWHSDEINEISPNVEPKDLILELANKFHHTEDEVQRSFLKVVGEDSYLIGQHRMIDFEYIREQISLQKLAKLVVVDVKEIDIVQANDQFYKSLEKGGITLKTEVNQPLSRNTSLTAQSFNLMGLPLHSTIDSTSVENKFAVMIKSLEYPKEYLANGSFRCLCLQMGIYHGSKPLCSHVTHTIRCATAELESGIVNVDKEFQFRLKISSLSRESKICVSLFDKRRTSNIPLFWVNSNLFDYKGKLKWKATFHMWKFSPGSTTPTHQQLLPLGPNIGNPNMSDAVHLVATFQNGDIQGWVEYPACVSPEVKANDLMDSNNNIGTITKFYTQELGNISNRDPLHDMTEQEKDLIWKLREYCLSQIPNLLPRVIDCVDYTNQAQVRILNELLTRWPLLPIEKALQLLDYAYPDENVRRFAVKCLRQGTDDVVLRYLLQLSQALKHESYFQNELVDFLLERALTNQHIGHYLFWDLKAEMNSPAASLRFGLILEAYLTSAPEHMKILRQQNTLIEKCKASQRALEKFESSSRHHDKAKARFQSNVKTQFDGHHPFVNFGCPLNPGLKCESIKVESCRLMNSKMRPQMLVFKNMDANYRFGLGPELEDIILIYKKGDDLRQDQLTLQLLKVMDILWNRSGLDLRLNVYRCLATDTAEGLIEVVQSAETICRVQMAMSDYRTTAVFRKGLVLSWLKKINIGEEAMKRAQWEFTQSCAGYSVATYILGIGDRHNDNIMIKKNGQMFHIDFGHFLGNFKHKFGFRRERVPMILSSEFVDVISADCGQPDNFDRFRALCEESYLTIRKHGSLIISLLAMMISTGLPELSSEQDLHVIRSTLHLDRSEEYALEHFRKDFNESLRNAWTISLDWWFHMVNQLRNKGIKAQ